MLNHMQDTCLTIVELSTIHTIPGETELKHLGVKIARYLSEGGISMNILPLVNTATLNTKVTTIETSDR